MKRFVIALFLASIPIKAHADEALDLSRFEALNFNATAFGVCAAIGFQVNIQGAQSAISVQEKSLIGNGYTDEALSRIAEKQAHLGQIENPMQNIPPMDNDPEAMKAAMADLEDRFALTEQRCLKLINDPFLGYFIKSTGYQATDGPKSFFGMIKYQAEQGDAEKMFLVGSFYDFGVQPDPNHKQEFQWYSKSADAGYAQGAAMLAASYFTGRGIAKDVVEAIKWAVIASERGGDSEGLSIIDRATTVKQQHEGRQRAVSWLKSH